MDFGLSLKTLGILDAALSRIGGLSDAKIFGSRATGRFQEGSDIDLCLFPGKGFSAESRLHLMQILEESPIAYKVDVLIYPEIQNESLRKHIDSVGKSILKKESHG